MIYGRTEGGQEVKLLGAANLKTAWTEDGEELTGLFRYEPGTVHWSYAGDPVTHDGKTVTIERIYQEWN